MKIMFQDHHIGLVGDYYLMKLNFGLMVKDRIHERLKLYKNEKWSKRNFISLKRSIKTKAS